MLIAGILDFQIVKNKLPGVQEIFRQKKDHQDNEMFQDSYFQVKGNKAILPYSGSAGPAIRYSLR